MKHTQTTQSSYMAWLGWYRQGIPVVLLNWGMRVWASAVLKNGKKKKRAVKWFRETIVYNILIDGYIYKLFIIIITEYGALPGGYLLCDECIYLVISLIQLMGLNTGSCLGGCWHYAINEILNLTSVHIFHKCFIVRLGICR